MAVVPIGVRDWQHWAPCGALAWSLIYAALGLYWAISGRGFPYAPGTDDAIGPILGRFGPGVAWFFVLMAGIPAAAIARAMLRGVRGKTLRPLLIAAGALLAAVLLLLMTGLGLLVFLAYVPYLVVSLFTGGGLSQKYMQGLSHWSVAHQMLCLLGGFLWMAATLSYCRRSGDACLVCGRRDGPEGWRRPDRAARWGRIAVYVSMVAPLFYAFSRFVWALGFPLGMSAEEFRRGQERGLWISGLFLAAFGLAGALLSLGLVQRWGEVFPRWMIGLSRRRVPIALALIPAALVSVLFVVGGVVIWSRLDQMIARVEATGAHGIQIFQQMFLPIGPVLLFPLWGLALATAALAYYYRRRTPCAVCGRGRENQGQMEHFI